MFGIRRITPENGFDVGQINHLIRQMGGDRSVMTERDVLEIIGNPYVNLTVALDGERYVGMVHTIFQRGMGRWLCSSHDLVADVEYRGRGVGELLVKTGLEILREFSRRHGVVIQPYATSNPTRVQSNSLIRKYGYKLIAEAVGPSGTNLYKTVITPDD